MAPIPRIRRLLAGALLATLATGLSCEQLDVTTVDIDTIIVTPDPVNVRVGATVQLDVVLEDADGHELTRAVEWSSQAPSIVQVDAQGRVTGLATGSGRVVASAEGRSGTALVVVTEGVVASVDVAPATATLGVGETRQLTATPRDGGGVPIAGRAIEWVSESPGIATVSSSGLVHAVAGGSATIRATADGKAGTALITVQNAPVSGVTVVPGTGSIPRNGTLQLTAELRDPGGSLLTGRAVTWSSSAPAIASVDAGGLVRGVALGTATITAASEGITGTATITVESPPVASVTVRPAAATVTAGSTVQLTAETRALDGSLLTGRTVTWQSSATATATVDGEGIVTGVQVGLATITATSEGVSGQAIVQVQHRPVATVTVSPSSAGLTIGDTVRLSAALAANDGSVLTGRRVTWTSGNASIATVDTAGLVRAVAAGTVTITAESETIQGTSTITVSLKPVATVTLAPLSASLIVDETVTFTATLRAADNSVLTGRTLTWSTLNPAVATVDGAGNVTATGPGSTGIVATSEGKADTAAVTVAQKPVATVTILPASPGVSVGGTTQLTADLRAADNTQLTRPVAWTSSNQAAATIHPTSGLVTGVGVGTSTITATSEGVSGQVTLTVSLEPVASVVVTPATANLFVGDALQLSAVTLAADGVSDLGRTVLWSIVSISGDASVTSTGLVTGLAVGTVLAIGTAEGKADTATIAITLKPVNTVTVTPDPVTVDVNGTVQLSAALQALDGTPLTRPVTWASRNAAIASVDATGLVTGEAVGQTWVVATAEGKSDSSSVTVTLQPVASVTVTPNPGTVEVGATLAMSAEMRAADNTLLTGRIVTWASSNTNVATVDPNTGVVTGVGAGSVTITATSEGVPGTAVVNVAQAVNTVTVTPDPVTVDVNGTVQLSAALQAADGTPLTRPVTWVSRNAALASVDATGLVTGEAVGQTWVVATAEGKSDSASVTVIAQPVASVTVTPNPGTVEAGATLAMAAETRAADNTLLTGRIVTWSSSDTNVATVDPNTGVVTGVGAGSVTITATSEGVPGTAVVNVAQAVNTVTVTPDPVTVDVNGTVQLSAALQAADGTPLTRPVTWVSRNAALASVDATGLVTGEAVGQTWVVATAEGKSDSSSVTVTLQPVASVTVTPNPGTVEVGATLAMSAEMRAADNTLLTGRIVTWASSNTSVATVDPNSGVVTGEAVGAVTITATSEGVLGTATVDVTQSVHTVSVTPDPATVAVSGTVQLDAALQALDGTPLTRPTSWLSRSTAIASVDVDGLVTGVAAGQTWIVATSEGKSDSSSVTVTAQPVASVIVTPDPGTVEAGATLAMAAETRAADNTLLTGRIVTWSSSDTNVATVDPNTGVVTGVGTGSVTITATSEGVQGTATVNVTLQPVASVTVTPDPGTVAEGGTLPMTAELRAADNSVITGRTVTWSSSDTNTATIDPATGVVTGIAAGSVTITATVETVPGSGTTVSGTATATVDVSSKPVATVIVTPNPGSVEEGGTLPMSVEARAADNTVITGRIVRWSTSNANLATVDPATGVVTGVAAGSVTITATVEKNPGASATVVGTATVNVTPGAGSVTITATVETVPRSGILVTGPATVDVQ